jgi:hypothetical protein
VSALLKFVDIGLPTLTFDGLDGKADLDFLLLSLRNTKRQDDENERNSGEKTRRKQHEISPKAELSARPPLHADGMMAPAVITVDLPS